MDWASVDEYLGAGEKGRRGEERRRGTADEHAGALHGGGGGYSYR